MSSRTIVTCALSLLMVLSLTVTYSSQSDSKKVTKNPLFMTDIDVEKLLDEWEDNDEVKLPDDELPKHKQRPKTMDLPPIGTPMGLMGDGNQESFMKASKKGKTVMAFVTVAGQPTRSKTEELTQRWQIGLTNAHLVCQVFIIEDNRAIFVFEDGSLAYEAKDFLTSQPEVKEYSIDNQVFHGKGYPVEYPNKHLKQSVKDEL